MDEFKQLCKCYVVKSTLSIGIGIEVLDFWPVLVLVLVLKMSFNQELVLVLTSGLSEVLVMVLVRPNWYCLCLVGTLRIDGYIKNDILVWRESTQVLEIFGTTDTWYTNFRG